MKSLKPEIIDGIKCYCSDIDKHHQDYPASGLDNLYRIESGHFWFVSRREYIIQVFEKHVHKREEIIEIGAGTGSVARGLMSAGYKPSVGELHFSGLQYAKSYGIEDCYQFDLYEPPFREHFDVVGMFDVLEHLGDTNKALTQIKSMLRNNGRLILTVPAHMWLWSREDKIAEHKVRYTKATILKVLKKSGFEVIELRYFFILILPLLWLRKKLHPDDGTVVLEKEREVDIKINPVVNKVLLVLCKIEKGMRCVLPNVFGGSLMIVAKKL